MNFQASGSYIAMRTLVFTVNWPKGNINTEFTRNYLNFKFEYFYDSQMTTLILHNPKLFDAGRFAESLELLNLDFITNPILIKYGTVERWIRTFTNLKRLKLVNCVLQPDFQIKASKRLKVLIISHEYYLKVRNHSYLIFISIYLI